MREINDPNVRRHVEQIYENPDLRDELDDDQAQVLLDWGAKQIEQMDGSSDSSEQVDSRAGHVQTLLKRINRFVGQRAYLSDAESQEKVVQICESAQALAVDLDADAVCQILPPTPDPNQDLQTLLGVLEIQQHATSQAIANTNSEPEIEETESIPEWTGLDYVPEYELDMFEEEESKQQPLSGVLRAAMLGMRAVAPDAETSPATDASDDDESDPSPSDLPFLN